MPVVSMFYVLIIYMYAFDNNRRHVPHIHVQYQGTKAVIAIPSGELLDGALPPNKMRLLLAWIEIHQEDLLADWLLAVKGESIFRIDPLR